MPLPGETTTDKPGRGIGHRIVGFVLAASCAWAGLNAAAPVGDLRILFIRVSFSDDPTDPQTAESCQAMMDGPVSDFIRENSYGLASLITTVTPRVELPHPREYYAGGPLSVLVGDAVSRSGHDVQDFDSFVVRYIGWSDATGGGATAFDGVPGIVLTRGEGVESPGIACHELGHCLGLGHASAWEADGGSVVGVGTTQPYGNLFDTMGGLMQPHAHYNAYAKHLLGWLPDANVQAITAGGTYRLHSFDDVAALTPGLAYALRFRKDARRDYWLDQRRLFPGNATESNGVEVLWDNWQTGQTATSYRLDTTPGSAPAAEDARDSALRLGWTLLDEVAGIAITPIAKESAPPNWMDVEVHFGPFPGNRPPEDCVLHADATSIPAGGRVSFTCSASDPDGDSLAYGWDFGALFPGDKTPVNESQIRDKVFPAQGVFPIRCVVSDKRGGRAADSVLVRVGNPSGYRIAGNVTVDGMPLEGVRVAVGSRLAYTDSDGTYTIPDVPARVAEYSVAATKGFHECSPAGFPGTVTVGPDALGKNFTCVRPAYTLAGRVRQVAATPVTVTAASGPAVYETLSDPNGNYAIAAPIGTYTLTAARAGAPDPGPRFTNPVLIEGADVAGLDFTWPIAITTPDLPAAARGIAYSAPVTALGGDPPYAWSVVSGALPPGLSLTPDGTQSATISGVPSAAGTYSFTVKVTDMELGTVSRALLIVVALPPGSPLEVVTTSLPNAARGAYYQQPILAGGGSGSQHTWRRTGSLPPGMSLTPTGTPSAFLRGTPTSTGIFAFTVTVTDSAGAVASRSLTVTVRAPWIVRAGGP